MKAIQSFGITAVAATLSIAAHAAPQYHLTELDSRTVHGSSAIGSAINEHGKVAGSFLSRKEHAMIWAQDGNGRMFEPFGDGFQDTALAINGKGVVVGVASTPSGSEGHAFMVKDGVASRVFPDDPSSSALGIASDGTIVGAYFTDPFALPLAYALHDGTMTWLGTLGGPSSTASAVSRAGIVGWSLTADFHQHAFLVSRATMTMVDLGVYDATNGFDSSAAFDINGRGDAVGECSVAPDGTNHACLFQGGKVSDLGTLLPDADGFFNTSAANGISASGVIVGSSATHETAGSRAVVFEDGQVLDLNALTVDRPTGWTLTSARGVNARGQITGTARENKTGTTHAFVLTPLAN